MLSLGLLRAGWIGQRYVELVSKLKGATMHGNEVPVTAKDPEKVFVHAVLSHPGRIEAILSHSLKTGLGQIWRVRLQSNN